jgi:hypothetical protein
VTEELSRELGAVGIRGRLRARILAEASEHLLDGAAQDFGDPRMLARQFAEELGAAEARRAARWSFAALALAGCVYAAAFLQLSARGGDVIGPQLAAAVGMILLPQVSFVAGALAPVARSPRIAVRRASLGLAAGAGSLGCAWALGWRSGLPLAVAGIALGVAAVATVRAARIRTATAPFELQLSWRAALVVAAFAALAVGVAGASGGDPGEGVRNALAESIACMSGFAVFGKAIGIRR